MDVHKSSLLAVFDAKQRLEVPLFQRQYVWSEEQQWLPLGKILNVNLPKP